MEANSKLCAWGTSRAVRIPKDMCEEVGMDIGSTLTMTTERDGLGAYIIVRPERQRHRSVEDAPFESIEELFAGYDGEYLPHEADWGEPVGMERIL